MMVLKLPSESPMPRTLATAILCLSIATPSGATDPDAGNHFVTQVQFTTDIRARKPVDNLVEINGATEKIYCFTEFSNLTDQVIIHRWNYKGAVVAEARLRVNGPPWRVWSSRTLTPDMQGSWTVVIMNSSGNILAEKNLDYNISDPVF